MKDARISMIAAMNEGNRAIGRGGKLLWKISADLKRFKELTTGHPIIMGRKTFESIGKVLPERVNIIITRNRHFKAEGAIIVSSLKDALRQAQIIADTKTRIDADEKANTRGSGISEHQSNNQRTPALLYEELTYRLRGVFFAVHNALGPGHKESLYQNALAEALTKAMIPFERERSLDITFENKKVGTYRPDFIVDKKILIELKAIPFLGQLEQKQLWHYLRGSEYKLALLVNFGAGKVAIKRVVYDSARLHQRTSASYQRASASSEIFVIGGGEIYREALPIAHRLYLTLVESDEPGDTFFPDYSDFKKMIAEEKVDSRSKIHDSRMETETPPFRWVTLERSLKKKAGE